MPILNATSIPYTGVPTVGTPPDAGGQTQRISADASSFGSFQGAATSQLGQTLERAGDQFAQIAIQRQEIYNKVAVTEAGNNLTDNWNKTLFGDPNNPNDHGYYGTQGRQAGDEFPNARNKIDTAFNDARSQLQNPQQQLLFDAEMRRQRAYNLSIMGRHYDNEYKRYTNDTYKAEQGLATSSAASAGAQLDYSRFNDSLAKHITSIYKQGEANGWSQTTIDNEVHKARATYVKIWTESLVAGDKAADAEVFLKNNADAIGGVNGLEYPQLLKDIQPRAADERFRRARAGEKPTYIPPGVSYTPASDILSGTGLSSDQYQNYREYLASREQGSQGYATPPNAQGHYGRYQFGDTEVRETAARLGVPVPNQQEFLNNPNLQEKFLENYTLAHHNDLMQKSEKYRNASPAEKAGILMGAHLGGVTGVTTYLEGKGDPEDANHTRVSDYVSSMKRMVGEKPKTPDTVAQPAVQPPSSAQTKVGGIPTNLRTVGDSLSGMLVNSGVPGALDTPYKGPGQPITSGRTSGGSDQPDRILARMKGLPDDFYKGNTIFLTAGSNMPSKIGYVEDQIALARARGAEAVIVPALGPGIKGGAHANQVLRYFAAEKGAIFFEPNIEWDKEGVHPKNAREVAKFRQQGLDALAAAKGPPT